MQLDNLFDKLWHQYISESPDSGKIHDLLLNTGENIINDHVAFRTFDDPRMDLDKLGQFFKDSWHEVTQEVTWPKMGELQSSATLVLVASLIFALVVGAILSPRSSLRL